MKNTVKFSIRKKLFLFILIAFSLQIILIVWQIRQQAFKVSSETIQTSLQQSITILETKLESRFFSIREVANGLSKDGRVLPLVFEGESLTLQDLSLEFKDALDFDSLFLTDDEGIILARSDRPEAVGLSIRGRSPLFDNALEKGESTQSFIVSQGRILQIVVEPIRDNVAQDIVRGLVAVAYELSPEIAADINKLTASGVGFFAFSRAEDRSINGADSIYITDKSLQTEINDFVNDNEENWTRFLREPDTSQLIATDNETYFAIHKVVTNYDQAPLGFVLIFKSRTELLKPFNAIEQSVIIIGMLTLVFSIIIGILISLQLTKPILKLVTMTSDIQEGKYPQQSSMTQKPNDELDLLFNSVVQMGNSIKEKNELESYLAGIANEIEVTAPADQTLLVNDSVQKATDSDDTTGVFLNTGTTGDSETVNTSLELLGSTAQTEIDGRYKLLKNIGQGQFGIVFLALDQQLNEKIALKVLDKNKLLNSDVVLDFHEEIKLARRITHRNITRSYDFGDNGEIIYITMEFIDGFTLEKLIRQNGPINVHLGLIFIKQMCSAIHAAHEQGIIHRDLKPQNISITQQGVLKIMDFGLAVSIHNLDAAQREKLQRVAAGTPRFMAPEQFFGSELDTRTDIYALGVIMYYIFTGKAPYNSRDFKELAEMHLEGKIPNLSKEISGFPTTLSEIVTKAMQKSPNDRYQSVKQVYEQLSKISLI